MATRLERTITVPGDRSAVFDYVADFSNSAEWDPGVVRASRQDGDALGTGNAFTVVAEFGGRELTMTYHTTVFDRPQQVRFEGGTDRFTSIDTISFSPVGDGTQVDYVADFILSFPLSLAEPFLKGRFERLADDAVAGLHKTLSAA